jgi:hypothetical protein
VISAVRTAWPAAMTALVSTALVLVTAAFHQTAGALPLVERVAELALAGGAAYLLDDAAAQLTSVVPRGQWRRRAPVVAAGGALLAGAWLGILVVLQWRDARPPVGGSFAELLVMSLVAIAAAAVLVRLGDPEPGAIIAPIVVMVGLGLVIVGSVVGAPIYLTDAGPTVARGAGWSVAAALAVLVLVVAGRDPAATGVVPDVTPPWRRRSASP